ncbi:MAG: hypothetical protein JJLCMIEE_03087 [Acidimicrobiales bacterium]|nr:hypothetical protein [Acidimicrobiales bacterium]
MVVILAATIGCTSTTDLPSDDASDAETESYWFATSAVPAGLELAGAATFPGSHPFDLDPPIDLHLVEGQEGQIGFFIRERTPEDEDDHDAAPSGPAGPEGLEGVTAIQGDQVVVGASRDVPVENLEPLVDEVMSGTSPEGLDSFSLVTVLSESPVPGMGSLPIPAHTEGSAVSWTREPEVGGFQRSLAVGAYEGDDPAAVLEWWFDGGESRTIGAYDGVVFTSPAYAVADESQGVVPEAVLFVTTLGDAVVMVRTVDVPDREFDAAVEGLESMTEADFLSLEDEVAGESGTSQGSSGD